MDEQESRQGGSSDIEFPAHSLAMSCVTPAPDTALIPSVSSEEAASSASASNENVDPAVEAQPDVVKHKSIRAIFKRKSDKTKGKKKKSFFKKFNCVQNQSADNVNCKSNTSLSNNVNKTSDSKSVKKQVCQSEGLSPADGQYDDTAAISPASTSGSSQGATATGSVSNMGAGPSQAVNGLTTRQLLDSVPPVPRNIGSDSTSFLRQLVPVCAEAMEEHFRREAETNRRRDHVAYPHLHYPSSNRSTASESSSNDSMSNLASGFRNQCSTSTPHYPAAGATSSLSSFRQWGGATEVPAPTAHLSSQAQNPAIPRTEFTQVDYAHFLVPDLLEISRCGFYWGVMDRYEAERLLDSKREGTFLLRDSAQEEFLFSVSFRRYGRSLHARIDQWSHRFSFDTHDSGVFAADSVTGLIEHYKDPSSCMFFEPMLTIPLSRNFPFSLQHLARAAICKNSTYDGISLLPLPKPLIEYLKYYHYKLVMNKRKVEMPVEQKA